MVAGSQRPASVPDGVDDARAFVAQDYRHRNAGVRPVGGMKAAMAYAACHHPDPHLAEPRVIEFEFEHLHRLAGSD